MLIQEKRRLFIAYQYSFAIDLGLHEIHIVYPSYWRDYGILYVEKYIDKFFQPKDNTPL